MTTSFYDDSPEGRIQRLRGALQEIASYPHLGAKSVAQQALANDDYSRERLAKTWSEYLRLPVDRMIAEQPDRKSVV